VESHAGTGAEKILAYHRLGYWMFGRFPGILASIAVAFALSGCASRRPAANPPAATPESEPPAIQPQPSRPPAATHSTVPPAVPGEYTEQGVASWYGVPFNGRRTSNGEIYDMHQLTAAHRTLPFNAVVRVTNLSNGKQVNVRVNDRGPFVANRIIDLSYSAAEAIGMVGPGTAEVRLDVVAGPDPNVGFFGVQVGAFQIEENAERLQKQLSARYTPVTIAEFDSPNGVYYRVRAGRLPSEAAARELAAQIEQQENTVAFVVRLDD
jgi:rare lipoprotein A